jgi:hypothetical protein
MAPKPIRRDLLRTTATLAATSALALKHGKVTWAKEPADAAAGKLPQVDANLRAAVSACDAFWWSEPMRCCGARASSRSNIPGSHSFSPAKRQPVPQIVTAKKDVLTTPNPKHSLSGLIS